MNDRFKFRCWDDYNREMLNLQEQDTNPYNISDFAQHNIMQCTGLKDKNGKLIYEGDIVRFQYGNGYRIGAVEVDKCDWRISNSNFCQGAWCGGALICLYETCEIIGNIYENKELLEEECQKN